MTIAVTQSEGITAIGIEGSIDGKTAPEIQSDIFPVVTGLDRVILDLTKVDYMSSAGLRMLLTVYRQVQSRKGHIALVGVSAEIQDVMSHTGFIGFFTLAGSVEEAVALLKEAS